MAVRTSRTIFSSLLSLSRKLHRQSYATARPTSMWSGNKFCTLHVLRISHITCCLPFVCVSQGEGDNEHHAQIQEACENQTQKPSEEGYSFQFKVTTPLVKSIFKLSNQKFACQHPSDTQDLPLFFVQSRHFAEKNSTYALIGSMPQELELHTCNKTCLPHSRAPSGKNPLD